MTVLVTGGTGFAMSVLAKTLLDRDPLANVVLLDQAGLDAAARKFFAPVADRMTLITADVLDPAKLTNLDKSAYRDKGANRDKNADQRKSK